MPHPPAPVRVLGNKHHAPLRKRPNGPWRLPPDQPGGAPPPSPANLTRTSGRSHSCAISACTNADPAAPGGRARGVRRALLELPCIQRGFVSHGSPRSSRPFTDAERLALAGFLAVHARLRHLAGDGAFKPFSQRLDLRALGYELVAFMSLWVSQTDPAILAGLLAMPEVIAVRYTTRRRRHPHAGRRENTRDLHRITRSILAVAGVVRSSTAISLDEVIPCWPHALLRVAAGSWRRPVRSRPSPEQPTRSL